MTKKMKGVALNSSPYSAYGTVKTMFEHQTLMQDYLELQKDVEASRNKLENMKQRKVTLLAEVRFLRRRSKYLLKNKSPNLPQEQKRELVQPQCVENQRKNCMKVKISNKKEATLHNLPPVFKLNQKGKVYMGKEVSLQNTVPSFDLNHKEKRHSGKNAARINPTMISNFNHRGRIIYKGKEVAHQSPMPIIDLNHRERIYNGNGAAMRNPAPVFDLNQKETPFSVKQASLHQAPIIDLNQISREEEEFQDNCEPLRFEDPKKGLINEDHLSDLKLSVCRNVGDSSSRAAKRKISWQDPVALRV